MDLFYLCSLLICNAVISSIKMCPLVWITRLKGLTMSVVKNIFSDLFKWFFFEQVQSCLQSPNVSHIMRITAFYFIFFGIMRFLVFLAGTYTWQKNLHTQIQLSVVGNVQNFANVVSVWTCLHSFFIRDLEEINWIMGRVLLVASKYSLTVFFCLKICQSDTWEIRVFH